MADHGFAISIMFIMAIIKHGSFTMRPRRLPAVPLLFTLVLQPQQRKMADGVHVQGARLERWASRRGVWRSCDLTAEACAILARYASWARGACWNRWKFNQPLDDDYDFTTILKSNSIALIGRSRDLLQPQGSVHASREPDGTQTEPATPVSATGLLISPC